MDHAPGPIIAIVEPNTASVIGSHGSLVLVNAIHNSRQAIMAPVMGVHIPASRSTPPKEAMICGMIDGEKGLPLRSMNPTRIRRMAVKIR